MTDPSKKSKRKTSPEQGEFIFSQESQDGNSPSSLPAGQQTAKSGPDHAHVSHFHRPGGAEALRMSATSGLFSENLSASAVLQRSLESRLLQRMAAFGSMEYALTWKRWDMPSGPPICALRASTRRTSGKDCGGWPTPTSVDRVRNEETMAKCIAFRKRNANQNTVPLYLGEVAAMAGWQSPTAQVSSSGRKRNGKANLLGEARPAGWASPTATTWGGSAEAHLERKRKANLKGAKMGVVVSCLGQQAQMAGWATPRTSDSHGAGEHGQGGKDLRTQVLGTDMTASHAPTEKRGALSPALPRWLMGFPAEWCEYAPTATRSSRK